MILNFMNYYIRILYQVHTSEYHPHLKTEQFNRVYEKIRDFAYEKGVDEEDLREMAKAFFDSNINTDYNINHFASDGILTNRFFETSY